MKTLAFIIFLIFGISLYGQVVVDTPETHKAILKKRENNKTFLTQTLNYAPLSYISPPYGDWGGHSKKFYMLSADISPQFVIGGKRIMFPIHFTPRFKVRIFHNNLSQGDTSLPVRTPSYMPGATIYIPISHFSSMNMDNHTPTIWYGSLSYFHHSNGQDGNEFNPNGSFNFYNGNFSTNYIEPALHFRHRKFFTPKSNCTAILPGTVQPYNDFYAKIGVEKHFFIADALKSSYGDYRLNLSFSFIRVPSYCSTIYNKKTKKHTQYENTFLREHYRLIFNSTFILGKRDRLTSLSERINLNLNYNWRVPASPNTALFVGAGYYGSDTYNIYYSQSYFYVNCGISLGFFVVP